MVEQKKILFIKFIEFYWYEHITHKKAFQNGAYFFLPLLTKKMARKLEFSINVIVNVPVPELRNLSLKR